MASQPQEENKPHENGEATSEAPKEDDEFEVKKMTPNERAERLLDIYNRMQEIEADRAPARASSILAGLGFSPDMQQIPTKVFILYKQLVMFLELLWRLENESFSCTGAFY